VSCVVGGSYAVENEPGYGCASCVLWREIKTTIFIIATYPSTATCFDLYIGRHQVVILLVIK